LSSHFGAFSCVLDLQKGRMRCYEMYVLITHRNESTFSTPPRTSAKPLQAKTNQVARSQGGIILGPEQGELVQISELLAKKRRQIALRAPTSSTKANANRLSLLYLIVDQPTNQPHTFSATHLQQPAENASSTARAQEGTHPIPAPWRRKSPANKESSSTWKSGCSCSSTATAK
jgi:hypothetical protein